MKYIYYFLGLILAITTFDLTSAFAKDAPSSAEQLRNELESSLKIKDTNAVMSLFNPNGETNEWRESAGMRQMMIILQTRAMLQTTNASVKLLPMPKNFPLPQTNEQNGISTKFNVPVVGMIEVKGENGSVQQLPYGKDGDNFYIAGTIQEKIPGKRLGVRVLAGPDTDSLTYTGSWVYVKGGAEITVAVSDKTNRFKTGLGDYIKSCTIQRTSTNSLDKPGFAGWFHFEVSEDGISVFQSPEMTNEQAVIYERK
jgi:hypothetical protein